MKKLALIALFALMVAPAFADNPTVVNVTCSVGQILDISTPDAMAFSFFTTNSDLLLEKSGETSLNFKSNDTFTAQASSKVDPKYVVIKSGVTTTYTAVLSEITLNDLATPIDVGGDALTPNVITVKAKCTIEEDFPSATFDNGSITITFTES